MNDKRANEQRELFPAILSVMTIDETKLRELLRAFLEENQKLNLSAFRTEELCWVGNILDSLALLNDDHFRPVAASLQHIVDIGTGGGFPLLPLAVALPNVTFVGIDSTQKKIDAIGRILQSIALKNVELRSERIEDAAHDAKLRGSFDLVTARALAEIPVLLEYAAPLLRVGGFAAFWKSTKMADELASSVQAQKILGMEYVRTIEYSLGQNWGSRVIVLLKKTKETPAEYPRKVGLPKQKPL